MILPIKLTDQSGLPGQGVPSFTLDPSTGQVIGAEGWPVGASGTDPITGEPVTADSIDYTNVPGLWDDRDQTVGARPAHSYGVDPNGINPASIWDYRGTPWKRHGGYQTESAFDKWRRAGKPTRCSVGDWTGTIQQALDAGVIGAAAASLPPGSVIQSSPGGGITVYNPGAVVPGAGGSSPQVAIGGSATPGAWLLGAVLVGVAVYVYTRR